MRPAIQRNMRIILISLLIVLPGFAGDPWKVPSSEWTMADAQRLLGASPWSKAIDQSKIVVRWESASPVRLALTQLNKRVETDDDPCYAIAVIGLETPSEPPRWEASLRATGRKAIAAVRVRMRDDGLVFVFPRDPELQQPVVFRMPFDLKLGNTVEFEARIGNQVVKQKFSLRCMTYTGRLEL